MYQQLWVVTLVVKFTVLPKCNSWQLTPPNYSTLCWDNHSSTSFCISLPFGLWKGTHLIRWMNEVSFSIFKKLFLIFVNTKLSYSISSPRANLLNKIRSNAPHAESRYATNTAYMPSLIHLHTLISSVASNHMLVNKNKEDTEMPGFHLFSGDCNWFFI